MLTLPRSNSRNRADNDYQGATLNRYLSASALMVLLVLVSACQTNQQAIGTVLGGAAGAALGYELGGENRAWAAAVGGLAGAFLGSEIGRRLDERDRQLAMAAQQRALSLPVDPRTGQGPLVSWQSGHNPGVYGSAQVVNVSRTSYGAPCRTVEYTAHVDGYLTRETQQLCN